MGLESVVGSSDQPATRLTHHLTTLTIASQLSLVSPILSCPVLSSTHHSVHKAKEEKKKKEITCEGGDCGEGRNSNER
ncbi:hypothetical protein Pmani_019366 [Petrolisthes manimaculis]|uniref:Uncharacterized protein n=1 Tax=Petrolisthes manimaculis TaxID=1843537 RepID=A0AAE1U7R8_9EUCA|nr:hypothetical protein Pmani_019366 [Petrolisthes manimaculis]